MIIYWTGKPSWRGRLSTVDLLLLTSLDQLLFIAKILLTFVTKQATFLGRSTLLSLSPFPRHVLSPCTGGGMRTLDLGYLSRGVYHRARPRFSWIVIFSGLILGCGLIVYVCVLSDEFGPRPTDKASTSATSGQHTHISYHTLSNGQGTFL
jgi:hypothetical protein